MRSETRQARRLCMCSSRVSDSSSRMRLVRFASAMVASSVLGTGLVDSNVHSLFFRSAYEQRSQMPRLPHCRTLDEMRALRMPAPTACDVVTPSRMVVVPSSSQCLAPPPTVQCGAVIPYGPVASCQPLTICQFYPYVCNHNRPSVRDWCLYCTRRFLFPEQRCATGVCHVSQNNVCTYR